MGSRRPVFGQRSPIEHFAAGDANKDGFLDAAELAATLHKQTWFAILSQGTEACFTCLDADNDGKLDAAEYRKVSRMGGHAEQHFQGADADNDGLLNLTEFTDHAAAKLKALEDGVSKKSEPRSEFKEKASHATYPFDPRGPAARSVAIVTAGKSNAPSLGWETTVDFWSAMNVTPRCSWPS